MCECVGGVGGGVDKVSVCVVSLFQRYVSSNEAGRVHEAFFLHDLKVTCLCD